MGILKKYKKNEDIILTNQELEDIKKRLNEIQEEFLFLNNFPKDKMYFEKVKTLGEEMGRLKKRLQQGLKINKKLEEQSKKCY